MPARSSSSTVGGCSYKRWNALLVVLGAWIVAMEFRMKRVYVKRRNGVRYLVSSPPTVILGAQFENDPNMPAFWGWVVQEAGLKRGNGTLCCVGVGAGTVLSAGRRYYEYGVGVDSSSRVLDHARKSFGVRDPLVLSDGIEYLRNHKFDTVLIDVFDGGGATWRFLDEVETLRKATGRNLVFNMVVLDEDARDAAAYAIRRLLTRWPYVRAFRDNPAPRGSSEKRASNVVVFASDDAIREELWSRRVEEYTVDWVEKEFWKWELTGGSPEGRTRNADYDVECARRLRTITREYLPNHFSLRLFLWCCGWLYLLWMRLTDPLKRSSDDVGPRWLALAIESASLGFVKHVLRIDWSMVLPDTTPKRGSLALSSPHGAYPIGSLLCAIPTLRCLQEYDFKVAAASPLFFVPLFREFGLVIGLRDCNKATLEHLLRSGCTVVINPGGIHEMIHADSRGPETIYAQHKLGVFKLAIKFQKPIILCYCFGENQSFTTYPEAFKRTREFIMRKTWVGFPWISGRWGFSLGPFPVLPHPNHTLVHVLDNKILHPPPPADDQLLDKQAEILFESYQVAMKSLFDAHKQKYLPKHIANKGLNVVRLGAAKS